MTGAGPGVTPPVRVFLCGDLATLGQGLDLPGVKRGVEAAAAPVAVQVLPGLCQRPARVIDAVRTQGAHRLVLGLCSRPSAGAELQTALRRAGFDPLGVELVDLGTHAAFVHPRAEGTAKAQVVLAGAVARARTFVGSRPGNLKPLRPAAVSRRSLLTFAVLEYQAVPAVGAPCRVEQGCRECVRACPVGALEVEGGTIRLQKTSCTGCGICVSTCPYEAMDLPRFTPAALGAQITALLSSPALPLFPRAILFFCAHGAAVLEETARRGAALAPGWLPVEVPSLEMVPPTWLFACLALGAAAVGMLPCPGGCFAAERPKIAQRLDYCREVLTALGAGGEQVFMLPEGEKALITALHTIPAVPHPAPRDQFPDLLAPRSRAQALVRLAGGNGAARSPVVAHPVSPFGVLDVAEGCTLCGGCAAACPADALRLEDNDNLALTFDAGLCTACGQCVPVCPEPDVLTLSRRTDPRRLAAGRVPLARGRHRRCQRCGEPIAPQALLRRLGVLLAGEHASTLETISRYCSACRGVAS